MPHDEPEGSTPTRPGPGEHGSRPPRVAPSRLVKPLTVLEFIRDEDGVWTLPARLVADLARRYPGVRFESPPDRAAAERLLLELAEKLLANPVVEDYRVVSIED